MNADEITYVVDTTIDPTMRRCPVFVDDTGNRARAWRILAVPLVWLAATGAGFFVAALVHDPASEGAPAIVHEELFTTTEVPPR